MSAAITIGPVYDYSFEVDSTVAWAMKKLLNHRGLRVKDVMQETGWSRPTVSRHINGKRSPNYEQRGIYAKLLGVERADVDAIFGPLADGTDVDLAELRSAATFAGLTPQGLLDDLLKRWNAGRRVMRPAAHERANMQTSKDVTTPPKTKGQKP